MPSDFYSKYWSQSFQGPGGLVRPGSTLMLRIEPLGLVVTPPLLDSRAEGRLIAWEHSIGGARTGTWFQGVLGAGLAAPWMANKL